MNPALHISYDDLVLNYATLRGRIDATTAAVSLTAGEKRSLSVWLSNAMREAWDRPRGKDWVWPFAVQSSASVSVTSGVVALADLSYPVWFSFWSADPRPANTNAYRIPVRMHDASGIYPQCDTDTIFGLYVPRAPEFNSTAWTDATAVSAGGVRYDSSTGQCYRAKIDVPATSIALTNTTYWEEQLIPKQFDDYLMLSAYSMYLTGSAGQHATASKYADQATEDLEREFIAAFRDSPTGSGKPFYAGGIWR